MIELTVPGFKKLRIENVVMDYNGTLACDGKLIDGVRERFKELAQHVDLHVVTADTFGLAAGELRDTDCRLTIIDRDNQAEQKLSYLNDLTAAQTVAIGNGRNDQLLLKNAVIGIATLQDEGASVETLCSADIVVRHINDALDLLLKPLRLTATLRD